MNDVPAIECRGLRKQFAEGPAVLEVLKDINLVIGAGERTHKGIVDGSGIQGKHLGYSLRALAEKSLVTKLVSDIDGVNSVINNMTIAVTVAKK